MECKKHNIFIPKGLSSNFLSSISNFSQSGRRLCERFQIKLLNRILSDKYWLMKKIHDICDSLHEDLKCFNLGSRFYKQNDNMVNNKRDQWRMMNNWRLSHKFTLLWHKSRPPKKTDTRYRDRVEEAKKICDRTQVYNLSGRTFRKKLKNWLVD